jgi:integrase
LYTRATSANLARKEVALPRRPGFYKLRGYYCTSAGGQQHTKLCRVEEGKRKAELALRRLLGQQQEDRERRSVGPYLLLFQAVDQFLSLKQANNSESAYIYYKKSLKPLRERFGMRAMREGSVTLEDGIEYKRWLSEEKEWGRGKPKRRGVGPITVNHFLRCARHFFNWAMRPPRKYLTQNPWLEIKLNLDRPRTRLLTDEEFGHLLNHIGGIGSEPEDFREMLRLMWFTTLRPGEARLLKWEYVEWGRNLLVYPPEVIKTRTRRTVSLLDQAKAVLMARHERAGRPRKGYVFLNRFGRPFSANPLSNRFRRLFARCVKLGLIERELSGEKLCLYSFRHRRIA